MKGANKHTENCRQSGKLTVAALIVAFSLFGGNADLYGQDSLSLTSPDPLLNLDSSTKMEKIYISADSLMVDSENSAAEFTGHVRAVQGDLVINADEVKMLFNNEITDDDPGATHETALERIVARGHVALTFDNKTAIADQAVYYTEKQVLVLSGKNTKVMMGENSITGTQITLYRIDGRVEVEGKGETRVEGVFFNEK